ncbi:phage holin family protein [Falsirhodobacter sp. 20TX0035]|uniref:phage holin family protein n=1 Tax=Falsirhodobacter sp. 20TX0035 TaxID=3022019 RepID=UPI00232DA913|nr:phage holin family protein [Falsirhodobacter sp. 20TX0035]MDB6453936.1 phage holin family protein [Falsirhodobacter sp. 20TX0035]
MTPGRPPQTAASLADLATVLGRMVGDEVALARAEMAQGFRRLVGGVVFLMAAAVLLLVALHMLAGSAAAALALAGVHPVLAPALVGGVLLLLAAGLILWAVLSLRTAHLMPIRTAARLRRDLHMIKEMMTHDPQT